MIKVEKKIIRNKPFFYLTERINFGGKFKRIQVYIGKNAPNDLSLFYSELERKEKKIIGQNLEKMFVLDKKISAPEYRKAEEARVKWKYWLARASRREQERMWRTFAMQFIFESNAIEGSRLSQGEVEKIIAKKPVKRNISRKEITEVENSIKAFQELKRGDFRLNQRAIIRLHSVLTKGLGVESGFKKKEIVVNNKITTLPGQVRRDLAALIKWWGERKRSGSHPLLLSAKFHQRFERIHPFTDGNGRVGRLIFNWMLMNHDYGPILFRNRSRRAYFEALNQADEGRDIKLYHHCLQVYRQTIDYFVK